MLDWLTGGPDVHRFLYLLDGRTLFLPRGPEGPIYLVPDAGIQLRLDPGRRSR